MDQVENQCVWLPAKFLLLFLHGVLVPAKKPQVYFLPSFLRSGKDEWFLFGFFPAAHENFVH